MEKKNLLLANYGVHHNIKLKQHNTWKFIVRGKRPLNLLIAIFGWLFHCVVIYNPNWNDNMDKNTRLSIEALELKHILERITNGSISNHILKVQLKEIYDNLMEILKERLEN